MKVKKIVSVILSLGIAFTPAQSAFAQIERWKFDDGSRLTVGDSADLDDMIALYEKDVPKKLSEDAKDAIVWGSGISVMASLLGTSVCLLIKAKDKEISKGKKIALKAGGIALSAAGMLTFVPGMPLLGEGLEKLEEDKSGEASGRQYASPKWMFDQLNREKEMLEQFKNGGTCLGFGGYWKRWSTGSCSSYDGYITDPKALGNYEGCYVILERPIQKKVYADREEPCFISSYWEKQDKRASGNFCKYNIEDRIFNLFRSGIKVKSHGIIIRQGDKFEFQEQKQEVHCAPI